MVFLKHLLKRQSAAAVPVQATPQHQPLPGQVANAAGGHAYPLTDWQRLERLLILGTEGGTYYASERNLTVENALAAQRCLAADGARFLQTLLAVSDGGRAPKHDPALFLLALAAGKGDEATRKAALAALPRVARTGAHLLRFAAYVEGFRGWGRGLKRAVANWYLTMPLDRLVLQVIKYQGRVTEEGKAASRWSHRDLLRLAHPATEEPARQALFAAIVRPAEVATLPAGLERLEAMRQLAGIADPAAAAALIRQQRLPRECVPGELLRHPAVWEALLEEMPVTAALRALGKLTEVGLLNAGSPGARLVIQRLTDRERLRAARVHPLAVLLALATYRQGRGLRGSLTWQPQAAVLDALDQAFTLAFGTLLPTGKRLLIGLDVSGSMDGSYLAGTPLSAREAAAALALVTLRTEREVTVMAFQEGLVPLALSARQRLDDVIRQTRGLPFGRTDCAQPMLAAQRQGLSVDAFVVLTDNETWYGQVHPAEALRAYRRASGLAAKLVVVGMTATGYSIADPTDAGMLDVVGFDTAAPVVMNDFIADRL